MRAAMLLFREVEATDNHSIGQVTPNNSPLFAAKHSNKSLP